MFKEGDLEELIGSSIDDPGRTVDEEVLLRNAREVLGKRSNTRQFERHFTMFNALSLLEAYTVSEKAYAALHEILTDYILTCKRSSQADLMLFDLLVEHYPVARALPLIEVVLLRCPYPRRQKYFFNELNWHREAMRPEVREAVIGIATILAKGDVAQRKVSARIDKALSPSRFDLPPYVDAAE